MEIRYNKRVDKHLEFIDVSNIEGIVIRSGNRSITITEDILSREDNITELKIIL